MTELQLPPNQGSNLVEMLCAAASASIDTLHSRVTNVRLAPSQIAVDKKCECILFDFDDNLFLGELRGRNRDLCVNANDTVSAVNRAIAVRVLLDGHAVLQVIEH